VPNFEGRFPTVDATHIPLSRSKGQRSRSPGPLILTHIVCHIFRPARPTNFKIGIRMDDDDPHQPQAPWPARSKVKVARLRDQYELSWPNAVHVSLEAGGGIPCRPNPKATLRVLNGIHHWWLAGTIIITVVVVAAAAVFFVINNNITVHVTMKGLNSKLCFSTGYGTSQAYSYVLWWAAI